MFRKMVTFLGVATVALTAAVTTAGLSKAEELTIRWGTEAGYKPFMYKKTDGGLIGFDYDIGNAICAELKAKCEWIEQDWDGIIPALQARKYDAILASMNITEERKRVVDFTGKYYNVPYRFVGRSDAGLDDGAGLAGKIVGVQRGTTSGNFLRGERPDVTVQEYPTQEEVSLDLASGRIDAALANMIVINDGFLNSEAGKGFEMFGAQYSQVKYFGEGAGIAVSKENAELRDKISMAIHSLREKGEYKRINDKYFPFDIYGQ